MDIAMSSNCEVIKVAESPGVDWGRGHYILLSGLIYIGENPMSTVELNQ